ncbi:hypothetical protein, partial [Serratia marcescens]
GRSMLRPCHFCSPYITLLRLAVSPIFACGHSKKANAIAFLTLFPIASRPASTLNAMFLLEESPP